jgi:hypothetical protein
MVGFEKFYNFYFDHFLIRLLDQREILVYSEVPGLLCSCKPVPRTPPLFLLPLAPQLCPSAPLLLYCSAAARRFQPPLATSCCPSPPRVAHSSSAALASSLLASTRLPRHFSLLPELPPSATTPPPWQMLAPPPSPHSFLVARELLRLKSSLFLSFSFAARTLSTEHHCHPLPPLRRPSVHRGPPPSASHCPLQPPGELPLTPPILPGHFSWSDPYRNHLAVATSSPVSFCSRGTHPSASSPSNTTTPVASSPPAAANGLELGRLPHRETPRRRAPPRRRLGRRGNPTSGHPLFLPSPPLDAP